MKFFLFFLLIFLVPVWSANNGICDPMPLSGIFKVVCVTEKKQNAFNNSVDSLNSKYLSDNVVTLKALENSQKFYDDAFNWILALISILLAILLAIWAYLNFKYIKDFENKFLTLEKNIKEQIGSQKDEFEKNLKEQIKNQKNEFENIKSELQTKIEKQDKDFNSFKEEYANMKNEIEKDREKFSTDIEDVYIEFVNSYFNLSMQYFYTEDKIKIEHFHELYQYFNILKSSHINLNNYEWKVFANLIEFAEKYSTDNLKDGLDVILSSLKDFIDHCKKINESKGLKEAKKLWNVLCNKLGGENIVMKAIDDFKKQEA